MRSSLLALALLFASLVTSNAALGQSAPAAARALFEDARALMKRGQFATACPKLEESLKLDSGMGTQFNLAHCWEKLGRTASAWALFLDVAAAARATNQTKREAAARSRAQQLFGELSRMRIDFPSAPARGEVLSNDLAVGRAVWGTSTPVDPGHYVIVAKAPEHFDWLQEVDVIAGGDPVVVRVPELQPVPAPLASAQVAEPSAPSVPVPGNDSADSGARSTWSTQQWVGASIAGAGAVGVATGAVFLVLSQLDNNRAKGLCTTQPCARSEANQLYRAQNDAEDSQRYALNSFGVGAAGIVVGAVLYFTASAPAPRGHAAWRVAPLWSDNGSVGAQFSAHF